MTSLPTTSTAPVSADATMGGPAERTRRMATCGAARATKPTGPAAAVAMAASATAASNSLACDDFKRTPREVALSSPNRSAPMVNDANTAYPPTTATATATGHTQQHRNN